MIAVDTSVLVAILRQEADAKSLFGLLDAADRIVTGAPTKFELLLVMGNALGHEGVAEARKLLTALNVEVIDWTSALADLAADAALKYGRGRHPARLNFGDCMAYALAKSLDVPLLFKGDDFAQTDVTVAGAGA